MWIKNIQKIYGDSYKILEYKKGILIEPPKCKTHDITNCSICKRKSVKGTILDSSIIRTKTLITDFNEYNQKLYFGEWANTIVDALWIRMPATELKMKLKEYVTAKQLAEPKTVGNPILS